MAGGPWQWRVLKMDGQVKFGDFLHFWPFRRPVWKPSFQGPPAISRPSCGCGPVSHSVAGQPSRNSSLFQSFPCRFLGSLFTSPRSPHWKTPFYKFLSPWLEPSKTITLTNFGQIWGSRRFSMLCKGMEGLQVFVIIWGLYSFRKTQVGHIKRGGNGKGGIRICLPVHCLSAWSDRQPYCHTNATSSPCWRTTKLRATIACQYTVGTPRCGDMVLRSRSPRKCHYPLFAYPLFKRALSGWPRFGSVRLRFGSTERFERFRFSVPAVPRRRGFLCVSVQFHKEGVFVCFSTVSQRGRRFRFRVRFLRKRFRRFRFPVPVRFLGHPENSRRLWRSQSPGALPKAGQIFQQPFSLPENAQTLAGIAFRVAGKSVKNRPAASKFAGKRFQEGRAEISRNFGTSTGSNCWEFSGIFWEDY